MYNAEKYIRQCIDSLKLCNLHDTEVHLISDGSDDATETICNEYVAQNSSINLHIKENGGPSSARNYGLSRSRGKYILFMDSDDYVIPERYNNFYSYLLRQDDADVVFNDYFFHNELCEKRDESRRIKAESGGEYLLNYISGKGCFWNIWSNAYNRKYLENNAFLFEEKLYYGEDLDFTYKIMMTGGDFRFVHIPYYCYRLNRAGSLVNTPSCRRLNSLLTLIDENYAKLKGKPGKTPARLRKRLRWEYLKSTAVIYQLEKNDRKTAKKLFRAAKSPVGADMSIMAPCVYAAKHLWKKYKNAG
jgi:glycosyltransferase involved in cell wall biosynthesis